MPTEQLVDELYWRRARRRPRRRRCRTPSWRCGRRSGRMSSSRGRPATSLAVTPGQIDARRFERLARRCRGQRRRRSARALRSCGRSPSGAGRPADFTFEAWAQAETRASRSCAWSPSRSESTPTSSSAARPRSSASSRRSSREHPLRERPRELLMLRPLPRRTPGGGAASAYRSAPAALDELGIGARRPAPPAPGIDPPAGRGARPGRTAREQDADARGREGARRRSRRPGARARRRRGSRGAARVRVRLPGDRPAGAGARLAVRRRR